jgi:uncharacterized protein (DUF433 family)
MGMHVHRTIVVSGFSDDFLLELRSQVAQILGAHAYLVTKIYPGSVSAFSTFYILPCGLSVNRDPASDYSILDACYNQIDELLRKSDDSISYVDMAYGSDLDTAPRLIASSYFGPEQQWASRDINGLITVNPEVMGGRPVIAGTRISVSHILRKLSETTSVEAIKEAYPHLSESSIRAAINYAASQLSNPAP